MLKDWADFVSGRRNSVLIQSTPLDMVPSPVHHLLFCPLCPTSQSRASPAAAATSLLYKGSTDWETFSSSETAPNDGRWELPTPGDCDPPPLLPVPRSGVPWQWCHCRPGWHHCGSIVRMLPMLLSPSPCGDAMARHRQHWQWHQQAAGRGPRELQL